MNEIREYLKTNTLLFDGGMGTYFAAKTRNLAASCEMANFTEPETILDIHREYLDAGAVAIKTNTFGANRISYQGDEELVERVLRTAYANAIKATEGRKAFVFADLGPMTGLAEKEDAFEEYRFLIDIFLSMGAENFLFETNAGEEALAEIASYIKEKNPQAYVMVSFAIFPDGYSREGCLLPELMEKMLSCPAIDTFGLNCVSGAHDMLELYRKQMLPYISNWQDMLEKRIAPLSLMPNAGYPVIRNNRSFYEGDPLYFAQQLQEMADAGIRILGGCCGTTPSHIHEVRLLLDRYSEDGKKKEGLGSGPVPSGNEQEKKKEQKEQDLSKSLFWNKLQRKEKVIAVELDSPSDISIEKFMRGAWELKSAGCDVITIADCPIAKARMDSSILACKVKRELGLDALPHLTCRDRNLNATKALLLGLYAEGIRDVLLVTGDPIPTAERDEVKSVYQFNSRKLAGFVTGLNRTIFPGDLHCFGALNINATNFDVQLKLAREKLEKGMAGFLTQPVLTQEAFDNLKRAREELDAYLLGGVIPVVSQKNAKFMDSEVNGIKVDPKIIELYSGKNREEGEELAIEISLKIMQEIAPYVDGYYLMTPFGRTGLIHRIIEGSRQNVVE